MNEETKIRPGLLPLTPDDRDFRLGAITKLPKLSELPDEFSHTPLEIKDQLGSDFCPAFSSIGASELQEGVLLSPEYQFALIKELMGGDVDSFGADLRSAAGSFVRFGSIEQKDCPKGFNVAEKDPAFLRRIENWPAELKAKALIHSKKTYVQVDGPYDSFDNIRATIHLFKDEKRVPIFGVRWAWPVNNPYIETPISGGGGHALYAIGFRKVNGRDYLCVVNSYGRNCGENGIFYFSREVINEFVSVYGAFMFIDLTKEEYQKKVEQMKMGIMAKILNLMKYVLTLQWLWAEEIKKTEPQPAPQPTPEPEPEPHISRIATWGKLIEQYENIENKSLNNPGAIKGMDGTFLKFDTYQIGFAYLCSYLTRAATGKHLAYPKGGETTMLEFQCIYSPKNDSNDPVKYSSWICNQIGVSPEDPIKNLL